jgi:beta-lactam-binding protein with PASTA domain
MWQLIREIATDAMAKFIVENGKDKKKVDDLVAMDFDELQKVFREVSRDVRKAGNIAELLRAQLPVYPV